MNEILLVVVALGVITSLYYLDRIAKNTQDIVRKVAEVPTKEEFDTETAAIKQLIADGNTDIETIKGQIAALEEQIASGGLSGADEQAALADLKEARESLTGQASVLDEQADKTSPD